MHPPSLNIFRHRRAASPGRTAPSFAAMFYFALCLISMRGRVTARPLRSRINHDRIYRAAIKTSGITRGPAPAANPSRRLPGRKRRQKSRRKCLVIGRFGAPSRRERASRESPVRVGRRENDPCAAICDILYIILGSAGSHVIRRQRDCVGFDPARADIFTFFPFPGCRACCICYVFTGLCRDRVRCPIFLDIGGSCGQGESGNSERSEQNEDGGTSPE
ncbi:hypothetical protein FRUB_02929 [Fimbriiglobus ruber]|uniref:Uncharacterized protein n=1 Tax=Fimbriiglobus ruber TaxID=1908690 RepID=A0A225DPD3_9BACT|nr:hypothetical protein FRUB_02929 [Fimbriiglobus ruber]